METLGRWLHNAVNLQRLNGPLVALVSFAAVLLGWHFTAPNRFVARCSYLVDWSRMPEVPNDSQATKVRDGIRKVMVAGFTQVQGSKNDIASVVAVARERCSQCKITEAGVRSALRVTSTTKGDSDVFTVEVTGRGSNSVIAVAEAVVQYQIHRARDIGTAGKVATVVRDMADADELEQKRNSLHGKASERERVALEWQEGMTRLNMFFTPFYDMSKAVHVVIPTVVAKRSSVASASALGSAFFAAVISGVLMTQMRRKRSSIATALPRPIPHVSQCPPPIPVSK